MNISVENTEVSNTSGKVRPHFVNRRHVVVNGALRMLATTRLLSQVYIRFNTVVKFSFCSSSSQGEVSKDFNVSQLV